MIGGLVGRRGYKGYSSVALELGSNFTVGIGDMVSAKSDPEPISGTCGGALCEVHG